jgi:hypothetical protein
MAIRGFGQQTLSGTAQPAFGTTLSAATGLPSPDVFTGNLNPASRASSLVCTVTNPYIFRKNDNISIGALSNYLLTSTVQADQGRVIAINTGNSTITVTGLTRAHAAGEFVVIGIEVAEILIQANANLIYVGEDSSVAANSPYLARYIQPGAQYELGPSAMANVYGTSHYWFLGTAADTFLPSVTII